MKKTITRKTRLDRTTIRSITPAEGQQIAGGATNVGCSRSWDVLGNDSCREH